MVSALKKNKRIQLRDLPVERLLQKALLQWIVRWQGASYRNDDKKGTRGRQGKMDTSAGQEGAPRDSKTAGGHTAGVNMELSEGKTSAIYTFYEEILRLD